MTTTEREYAIAKNAVSTLSVLCAGSSDKIIDLLTGYLWTAEEATGIKKSDGTWDITKDITAAIAKAEEATHDAP